MQKIMLLSALIIFFFTRPISEMMKKEEIDRLIGLPKTVLELPSKDFKTENNYKRNQFKVQNGDEQFTVFLRQNLDFFENFSIGLLYNSNEGKKILLYRANGNHGEVVEEPLKPSPHFDFHIHRITEKEIEDGNLLDPHFAVKTDQYSSFEQAISFFGKECHILNIEKYFPQKRITPTLFDDPTY